MTRPPVRRKKPVPYLDFVDLHEANRTLKLEVKRLRALVLHAEFEGEIPTVTVRSARGVEAWSRQDTLTGVMHSRRVGFLDD